MFVPFQPSLIFTPQAISLPYSGAPERMTRLAWDKQPSLFSLFEEIFYNIDPRSKRGAFSTSRYSRNSHHNYLIKIATKVKYKI